MMRAVALKDALAQITASKSLCYVYFLVHPDGYPFYVGIGQRYRISQHERDAKKDWRSPKLSTIRAIHAAGHTVMYSIVGWFDSWADGAREEVRMIELLGRADLGLGKLTNLTDGGEGAFGLVMSEAAREKCRINSTGRTHSAESRLLIGAAHRGKVMSEASRKKMSASRKGGRPSDATINAGRIANLGRALSNEHKAKLREAKLGRVLTTEHRQKIGAALGGKPKSPEHAARAAEAHPNRTPIELRGVQYQSITAAQRVLRVGRRKLLRWLDTAEHGACFISTVRS